MVAAISTGRGGGSRSVCAACPRAGLGYGLLRYASPRKGVREALAARPRAAVSFNYLGHFPAADAPGALRPAREPTGSSMAPGDPRVYLLEVTTLAVGETLEARWTYGRDIQGRDAIAALADDFAARLRAYGS